MLFSGTSDLLSQVVKPHLNSSNDFSPLVISFQRFSVHIFLTLLNSLFISLFSSQRLWRRVDSPHLSSTCPFYSYPSRGDTVANFLVQASWIAFPFDHGFQFSTFDCVIILVSCTIIQSYWAVTCGSNVQARLARSIFSTRAKSCDVTSSHLSRACGSSTAARVFQILTEDHIYAGFEQTCHLNMLTWAWAEQLHAPRWIPNSRITSMNARFDQACHLNMPIWAWAEQLHALRWIPDSQITSSEEPWRSHSTPICRDWVAKRQ